MKPAGEPTAPPAAPRRLLRRIAGWGAFALLLLLVVLLLLYLLRRPLLEPLLRGTAARLLGEAVGAAASIERIDGNWVTNVTVRGLTLAGSGVLREVRDAAIELHLDPIALLRGDLGGLQRVHVRAAVVHLDLDAEAAPAAAAAPAPPPPTTAAPPDLAALLALLPDGAEVTVDALTVSGQQHVRTGPAHVRLQPGHGARRVDVDGPGAKVTATLHTDGGIGASLAVDDTSALVQLFTPLEPFDGGRVTGTATLRLLPALAIDAAVGVDGLRVHGQPVQTLAVQGRVETGGLSRLQVDVVAPGVVAHVGNAAMQFDDPLGSLRCDFGLELQDLSPYAGLLPAAARDQLPIRGRLRARAADGVLTFDDGSLAAASGELQVLAGALRIAGGPALLAEQPLRARLELRAPERLPLPADLPLQPRAGTATILLGSRDGAPALDAELDLTVADRDGRPGRLRGSVAATGGERAAFAVQLALDGDLLRGEVPALELAGNATLQQQRLELQKLQLHCGADLALDVRGALPLGGGPAAMLAGAVLELRGTQLPVGALAALAPLPADLRALGGTLDLTAGCADGALHADVALDATGAPALPPAAHARVALQAAVAGDGLQLTGFAVDTPAGTLRAHGSVRGATPQALLDGSLDWRAAALDGDAEFAFADLDRVDLQTLAGLRLSGGLSGRASIRGTARAPVTACNLAFAHVTVAAAGPVVEDLDGALEFADGTLRLDGLRARVQEQALAFAGRVAMSGGRLAVRGLEVRQDGGGTLAVDAELPLPVAGDWRGSLREATVHARGDAVRLDHWLAAAGFNGTTATADARWQATAAPPLFLQLAVAAESAPTEGAPRAATAAVTLTGDGDGLHLGELRVASGDFSCTGAGAIAATPLQLLADPTLLHTAATSFDLAVPAFDLAALSLPGLGLLQLTGRASLGAHLRGTLAAPEPGATVTLEQVGFVTADGQRVDDIALRAEVTPTGVQLAELHALRGRGPIDGKGTFTAPGPLWSHWQQGEIDFALQGKDVLLHRRAGVKVRGDLDLTVKGPVANATIAGLVRLHDAKMVARIPLLDLRSTSGRAATTGIAMPGVQLGAGVGAQLDVKIATAEPFAISNNVVDGKFDVQLALHGPLSQPVLEGTISGPEAQLILPGMRLRASTLLVEFQNDNPRFPVVTVSARGRRHGYDVQCVVRGRYDHPQILLSSNPPLASDELVVLVTTGSRPDALRSTSGVSAVLGAYLAQELADWIFGSESTEAKESFLDRFTIETGTEISRSGTESAVVEFRVLDALYLQGERDVYEDLNMGVVYRVRFR